MSDRIDIDGAQGEGGGQILRTSLTLSLATGRPFRLFGVRAGRERPGVLRQHLAAIRAAAAVGDAVVEGAEIGSSEVSFRPRKLAGGEHRFAVGGAGSATLVLQTVLPALLLAREESRLVLEGGTHNPSAPPFDFLDRSYLSALRALGARVETRLERRGYFPAGGGLFHVTIAPSGRLAPLDLLHRGEVRARRARVLLANMNGQIAHREESTLSKLLGSDLWPIERVVESDGRGPGNVVLLEVECERVTEVFASIAMREIRAEEVARIAVDEMRAWLAADVPVGPHLADQLLLPLALNRGGVFRTHSPTRHTVTNAEVIGRFLPHAPRIESVGALATVTVLAPDEALLPSHRP